MKVMKKLIVVLMVFSICLGIEFVLLGKVVKV